VYPSTAKLPVVHDPPNGSTLVTPTARTPGADAMRSIARSKNARRATSSA
jgi:hypothetical protein